MTGLHGDVVDLRAAAHARRSIACWKSRPGAVRGTHQRART